MKFVVAVLLSFAALATAAPGYRLDDSATMYGSFTPEAYKCAAEAGNSVDVSPGTSTELICHNQDWINTFWCCLSKSTLKDNERENAWETFAAQCGAVNVHLGEDEFAQARSAAKNYDSTNSTNIPTVTTPGNETASASDVPSASSAASAPQATGAGSRSASSLAVMGAAIAGAIAMLTL